MTKPANRQQLVIFDADGTLIDAFHAVEQSFLRHGMAIGDLERFQKRRKLFKYLGGLREFPNNLRRQFGRQSRKRLLTTLTEFYREEARQYPGMVDLLQTLIAAPHVRSHATSRSNPNSRCEASSGGTTSTLAHSTISPACRCGRTRRTSSAWPASALV